MDAEAVADDYHGRVSWEYERAWFPDLPGLPERARTILERMHDLFDRPH